MADDHAPARPDFDLDTDEGLSAYVADLYAREGVPERLRYPETDEAYDRMIAEAEAQIARGEFHTLESVSAWISERVASVTPGKG